MNSEQEHRKADSIREAQRDADDLAEKARSNSIPALTDDEMRVKCAGITVTGADEQTDISALSKLDAEIGLLYTATPETDARFEDGKHFETFTRLMDMTDHAEDLERQRDEARAEEAHWKGAYDHVQKTADERVNFCIGEFEKLREDHMKNIAQRDTAIAAANKMREAISAALAECGFRPNDGSWRPIRFEELQQMYDALSESGTIIGEGPSICKICKQHENRHFGIAKGCPEGMGTVFVPGAIMGGEECNKCGGKGWIFKGHGEDEQCDCILKEPPETIATLRADLARVTGERDASSKALAFIKDQVRSSEDFDADEIIKVIETRIGRYSQSVEWATSAALREELATLRATISALEGEKAQLKWERDMHEGGRTTNRETASRLLKQRKDLLTRIATLEAGIAERDAAIEVAWQALEISRLMVRNEIMNCELAKVHPNAWPDLLTGCVSGGGIEAALAALAQCREDKSEPI